MFQVVSVKKRKRHGARVHYILIHSNISINAGFLCFFIFNNYFSDLFYNHSFLHVLIPAMKINTSCSKMVLKRVLPFERAMKFI